MWKTEQELWASGTKLVAGVDEVGRGSLSGPVLAAACIVDPQAELLAVRDSKKLSPARRQKLYALLYSTVLDFAIGISTVQEIEEHNILEATKMAMSRAVARLALEPQMVLVDGNQLPTLTVPAKTIIGGDDSVGCIAAASIFAKVTRDTVMQQLHAHYPEYNFASNKGYGTKDHMAALSNHGPCPVHRKTFSGVKQQLLFV
jgi:ribonuclease HII